MSLRSFVVSVCVTLIACAPPAPICSEGATRACLGPGSCGGTQHCLPDGTDFGACACRDTDGGVEPDGGVDDGGVPLPCGEDCALRAPTAACRFWECNDGQRSGPVGECVELTADAGASCDDGLRCTVADTCDESGACVGTLNDCASSPLWECNLVACNPDTGDCEATPDATKNDAGCTLTGELCCTGRSCLDGHCQGGVALDCSPLDKACLTGVCDPQTGTCRAEPHAPGSLCEAMEVNDCLAAACAVDGGCLTTHLPDGVACNDGNSCTAADACVAGTCTGTPVGGCTITFSDDFESCGWALAGDWECGTPTSGPGRAHRGAGVIATALSGPYSVNQTFSAASATSPTFSLAGTTHPTLSFWAWVHTEGGTADGFTLQLSADGAASFTTVTAVSPAYPLTIAGVPAWGGDLSASGWRRYLADLTPWAGAGVTLRFAFHSDGALVFPGVYVDELLVTEPSATPLLIDDAALPDGLAGLRYAATLSKTGGTDDVEWAIVGGTNHTWLSLDATTGVLSGTPTAAESGPVSVTVRVSEASLPSNFTTRTFAFTVKPSLYVAQFDDACPSGWSLTGDWQCGTPANVGPATAFSGTQCLATQLQGNYSDLQGWVSASSPAITFPAGSSPQLSFRMWVDTEGATYDGFNVRLSTDDGANFSVITPVTPAYPLTIAGQPAWGGHQGALGWQLVTADLSAYAGQTVRLSFNFRSDSSGTFPGVYLDDVIVR